MKPVVFLGPSLSHEEASKILDADFRPPVKRGDLVGLEDVTSVVGIIDGVLMNEAAVGHREILSLMRKGVTVIGGGSMGALRAAELKDFGMLGVGVIFELYSKGRIEGDDEVVLMYDPHTLRPLSEPLVNIRLNLDQAVKKGIIDAVEMDDLLTNIKNLYFPQRSYDSMMSYAKSVFDESRYNALKEFTERERKDYKEIDAKTALLAVKSRLEKPKNLTDVKTQLK